MYVILQLIGICLLGAGHLELNFNNISMSGLDQSI